eukprot:Blabericola_migrator_1__2059@NODE_1565_length_4265_cov_230_721772_g265_i3_p4_GENE_NODE_1565_length_4265_cov_230_721772_g265_i3NODE_1565_length_4265_cov_230_721772_g265_i3_p4_ORF_typecomplete_len107_score7_13Rsm1/PF08600_10/0_092_NODE_1565_length_4265_cov_230_721772_g265_i332823602
MSSLDTSIGLWMIRRRERLNKSKVSTTIEIIRREGRTVVKQQQSWCPISGNPSIIKFLPSPLLSGNPSIIKFLPYLVCIPSFKFLNLNLFTEMINHHNSITWVITR